MNRFLAEALGVMNALVALVILIGCGALGWSAMPVVMPIIARTYGWQLAMRPDELAVQGLLWGTALGLVLSVVLCGFIALLIVMYRELKVIRVNLSRQ